MSATTVAVALFTRDLRVLDNPVLEAAVEAADRVVPLFVLDPRALATSSPNRRWALAGALADLRTGLRDLDGDLVVREGRVGEVVGKLAAELDVVEVHVAADASSFAARRLAELQQALGADVEVVEHDSHTLVAPGAIHPANNDKYEVFTPYFRVWDDHRRRPLASVPERLVLPDGIEPGDVPRADELADGPTSPQLRPLGERHALQDARRWLANDAVDYEEVRDDLAADRTSRLSGPLHFGTVSARWVEEQLDLRKPGHRAFRRQLCWRDFNLQLLAAAPSLPVEDFRPRGDDWRDDEDAIEAWKQGRTGYPIVDAGMRQLAAEGWMHNRARMIVASFLTKSLYVDWRVGAEHFNELLVDADVANNVASWQWVAGTGTDTRPNRVYNPIRQAERYDPDGEYVRRWVPELSDVADPADLREPWRLAGTFDEPDYPPPIVDHADARERFLQARGA